MEEQLLPDVTTDAQEQSSPSATNAPASYASAPLIASRTIIEVVGAVQIPQDNKGRHHDLRITQGTFRTRTTRLVLHIEEEDGVAYTLPVEVPAHTAEREQLIAQLKHGDRVNVRGTLRTTPSFDTRFATDGNPAGRPTRQTTVLVDDIALAEADAIDGTWLRMTGRTSTVADIREHEYGSDDQVGRTFLVVEWSEPSQRPNSRATHTRSDRIPLDVPLALDGSTNALRGGNLVTVEGHLEPFQRYIDPERNELVREYLDDFQKRRAAEYATLSPQERRRQARQDQRFLQERRYEQCVRVRAGFVELHDGQPMNAEDASRERQAFVRRQKQRRRRDQTGGAGDPRQNQSTDPVLATPHSDTDVIEVQEQAERPVRHRRLAPREQDSAPAVTASNGQHAD